MQCSCRRSPEDTKGKQMSLARFTVAHLEKTYSLSLVMLRKTWNISPESMLSRCQAGDEAGYSMDLPCGPCSPNCATEKIKSGTSTWPKEVVAFAIVVATFDSSIFNSQSLNFLTTFIHCHMFFFCVCVDKSQQFMIGSKVARRPSSRVSGESQHDRHKDCRMTMMSRVVVLCWLHSLWIYSFDLISDIAVGMDMQKNSKEHNTEFGHLSRLWMQQAAPREVHGSPNGHPFSFQAHRHAAWPQEACCVIQCCLWKKDLEGKECNEIQHRSRMHHEAPELIRAFRWHLIWFKHQLNVLPLQAFTSRLSAHPPDVATVCSFLDYVA